MRSYTHTASIFKAVSDEKRIHILELLKSGEKCACELIDQMNIGQSSLSYHMKILCDSNIVSSRQDGKWTHYRLNPTGCINAITLLTEITTAQETSQPCCSSKSS